VAVTFVKEAVDEPYRFDFFDSMRKLERTYSDRPRIGDSAALRDEYVMLGQDDLMFFV